MKTNIIGQPISELDTPALLVDLDALERNISSIAATLADSGVAWRPHTKVHKCPAIAHKQLAAGAIGVACAKLGEAEVLVASGIRDIMVANQVVGPIKARRLASLCAHADVIVAVDSVQNVRELDAAARAHGTRPRVVIEVNTGMERCGTEPGEETVALAREVARCEGLRFSGLMAWEGQVMSVADNDARVPMIIDAVERLTATAAACRDAGIAVDIVSCGGTGTYWISSAVPGVTEVQAGGGIFGDAVYRDMGAQVEPALTLLTQIISRAKPQRLVLDAGRKAVDPGFRPPEVRGLGGVAALALPAEHCIVTLAESQDTIGIGDRLELEIGFSDQTVHLHDQLYGVRGGIVETIWPVAGRGQFH